MRNDEHGHGDSISFVMTLLGWSSLVGGFIAIVMVSESASPDFVYDPIPRADRTGDGVLFPALLLGSVMSCVFWLGFAAHLRNQIAILQRLPGAPPAAPVAAQGTIDRVPGAPDASGLMVWCAGRCRRRIPLASAHIFKSRYFCEEDFRAQID